jgi:hypothetical protein
MQKSSTSFPKPAKSGPPECPPSKSEPQRQRYNMGAQGMGKPGKVGPIPK